METLLSEELESFGVDDKKKTNIGSAQKLERQKGKEKPYSTSFVSSFKEDSEEEGNLISVGEFEQARGKATVLSREHDDFPSRGHGNKSSKKIPKSESLLNMEQDELAMSLSSAKFKLLKNANLERVKAEDRLSDADEGKHLGFRKMSIDKKKRRAFSIALRATLYYV